MRALPQVPARLRALFAAAPLALILTLPLAACGDDDDDDPVVVPTPTPTATPTGTPTPTSRNVSACLTQPIGATGFTPASLVVPDTLKINFAMPSGFPNGRFLTDPVIDVTLAVILLDLTRHDPGTLARIPLNPTNDSTPSGTFPFYQAANGGQPGPGTGTSFDFRTDPVSSYVRVDRMGQPAVATALIGTNQKNAYNDADPVNDAAGTFVPEITSRLTALHNALADDLAGASLTPCSRPG